MQVRQINIRFLTFKKSLASSCVYKTRLFTKVSSSLIPCIHLRTRQYQNYFTKDIKFNLAEISCLFLNFLNVNDKIKDPNLHLNNQKSSSLASCVQFQMQIFRLFLLNRDAAEKIFENAKNWRLECVKSLPWYLV